MLIPSVICQPSSINSISGLVLEVDNKEHRCNFKVSSPILKPNLLLTSACVACRYIHFSSFLQPYHSHTTVIAKPWQSPGKALDSS